METIEYRHVDKSSWGPGPWQDEPDKKQWRDEATGLPCLIVRGPAGALCGYVGLSPGHRFFGMDYDNVDCEIDVHWGLTFAGKCTEAPTRGSWEKWRAQVYAGREEAKRYPLGDAAQRLRDRAAELEDFDAYAAYCTRAHICHVPAPGEPDDVWWLGFDCAHSGDLCPKMHAALREIGRGRDTRDEYRDIAFVEWQVRKLARQLCDHTKREQSDG